MLSLRIALRYLFSKKAHRAVNIISAISIAGVAVATVAIVVVLSVFNGFSKLSEDHLSKIDPELKVTGQTGKVFSGADSLAALIAAQPGVAAAVPVVEDRAMLVSEYANIPIEFKAVGDGYESVVALDDVMIDGAYLQQLDSVSCIQLSVGVANRTGLRPGVNTMAELYLPRRKGRINPANPASSFRSEHMIVSGVLQVDQTDVDNDRIIIPLDDARRMLDYTDEASAIEISVAPDADGKTVREAVSHIMGEDFIVLDRMMQQADAFRMIEIEKWVTFMMLVFILVIASFNILSTLSLLVIEKQSDSQIFRSLGLSRGAVCNIFCWQGFLITVTGGVSGIIVGILLSLVQQHFGLIKLGGDPAALTIDVYPVVVVVSDIFAVLGAVILIAALTSQITRIFTKNIR